MSVNMSKKKVYIEIRQERTLNTTTLIMSVYFQANIKNIEYFNIFYVFVIFFIISACALRG